MYHPTNSISESSDNDKLPDGRSGMANASDFFCRILEKWVILYITCIIHSIVYLNADDTDGTDLHRFFFEK